MEAVLQTLQNVNQSLGGYGLVATGAGIAATAGLLLATNDTARKEIPNIFDLGKSAVPKELKNQADETMAFFSQKGEECVGKKEDTPEFVNRFYNMVTDIYEYGWGQSFHFSTRKKGESHESGIRRHEERLADAIGLSAGKTAIDAGCGVGGPMRAIAKHSGGNVVGITINQYQVERGQMHNKKAGLDSQCSIVQGNFLEMPFDDNTFECAYAVEATCHAPKLEEVYGEIYRVMKPGGLFGAYEWLKTPLHDESNPEHVRIIEGINLANGLPCMRNIQEVLEAAKQVGFELVSEQDVALTSEIPWYEKLRAGRFVIYCRDSAIKVMEFLRVAPAGTSSVHSMLAQTAEDLVAGGETGVFTPMHMCIFRKPKRS